MLRSIVKVFAIGVFAGGFSLMAGGFNAAPASADPADDAGQEAPIQDENSDEDGEAPAWDSSEGPAEEVGMLNGRDQQNYQDYLNGVPAGPVNVPASRGGYARTGGAAAPRRALPLPFVAPKGSTCGQMLATSVGGTMDNVVGMSTGTVLGGFGHNVLGPATGNLVGGVLVHLC
ncbi:hypothetical protein [Segniliparus rugosus]|uniref:Secreted protein n=1 Tax=Segniliparus rugosus (strain ATCC BAA-974 / DSM 45345 / CCUG 50838 / CIP 108380 / JCM 13579 / CDC 945) TaxID=679197 RepID=E5XN47_SEGRC|nr:hypothetical protein [Segniliparus rugosus]EFV14224.2 hypothetical protein HMPREF9336_00917 [Segniliparus rugosus ATCC BAA-974]